MALISQGGVPSGVPVGRGTALDGRRGQTAVSLRTDLPHLWRTFMTIDRQIIKTMTGEIFLPIRLYYNLHRKSGLQARLTNLRCMNYDRAGDRWVWLYDGEAKNLNFSTPYSSIPPHKRPIILGSFYSRVDDQIYLDVGSVERAIKAIEFFDKHIKRVVAEVKYVTIYNKICSNMEEHPGYCFDKIFSEIYTNDIDLTVEKKLEDASAAIQEGRIIEMMNAKNFELIEAFPAHYYEDGIHNLETSLMARQAVAVARWSGKADYCLTDFIKDATKRMTLNEMN